MLANVDVINGRWIGLDDRVSLRIDGAGRIATIAAELPPDGNAVIDVGGDYVSLVGLISRLMGGWV